MYLQIFLRFSAQSFGRPQRHDLAQGKKNIEFYLNFEFENIFFQNLGIQICFILALDWKAIIGEQTSPHFDSRTSVGDRNDRLGKLCKLKIFSLLYFLKKMSDQISFSVPIFQVVRYISPILSKQNFMENNISIFFRFPNDPCQISGGSKNGTCYTGYIPGN